MNYSYSLNEKQSKLIIKTYRDELPLTTPYMKYRAQVKKSTITIYTTNKLLIQGPDSDDVYQEILTLIDDKSEKAIIGTDEVGTGDYFGGITVCACFVPLDKQKWLRTIGVKDSKQVSDDSIYKLAPMLKKNLVHAVILLNNEKYNEITTFPEMNLNKIKAIMHNQVINKILTKPISYDEVIVDGFTTQEKYYEYLKKQKKVFQKAKLIEKAENQYLAVACASIIARYHFLEHLANLSSQYHLNLPKGAGTPVDDMIKYIIESCQIDLLGKIAKLNFKNTSKVKAKLIK